MESLLERFHLSHFIVKETYFIKIIHRYYQLILNWIYTSFIVRYTG